MPLLPFSGAPSTTAVGSEWTDTGTVLHPADLSGAETVVIGGTTKAGADIILDTDGSAIFNEQGVVTTGTVARFEGSSVTTGRIIECTDANSLTTGNAIRIVSGSSDTSATRAIAFFRNSSATGTAIVQTLSQSGPETALSITNQNTASQSILIDSSSTTISTIQVDADNTTAPVFDINATDLTSGAGIDLNSSSTSASTRSILDVRNSSSAATGATVADFRQEAANQVMILDQNSTSAGCSFIDFQGTAAANAVNPVSTFTTGNSIQGFVQIEINSTRRWVPFYDDPTS